MKKKEFIDLLKIKTTSALLELLKQGQSGELKIDPDYLQVVIDEVNSRQLSATEQSALENILNSSFEETQEIPTTFTNDEIENLTSNSGGREAQISENHKLISNFGAGMAIVCIIFLPFVGCGGQNLTGLDVIQNDQVGTEIKIFVIVALVCGGLIFLMKERMQLAITAIAGAGSLLIAYLIAHNKNEGIELKTGAFLALIGYAVTAMINFFGISNENQNSEK